MAYSTSRLKMYELLLDQENRTQCIQPQGSKCKNYCQIKKIEPSVLNIKAQNVSIIARSRKQNLAYSTSRLKMYELLLDQENRTWRTQHQVSKCINYCQIKKIEPGVLNLKAQNVCRNYCQIKKIKPGVIILKAQNV